MAALMELPSTIINDDDLSTVEWLSIYASQDEIDEFVESLDESGDLDTFLIDWKYHARPMQKLPDHDDWDLLFFIAGRGSGKTRPASEIVHTWAENEGWYIPIVGETASEVRDVMIDGVSGLRATAKPWNPFVYEPSKRRISWPKTGSWGTTFSGDTPDQLRGPNANAAWVDELAKFRYPDLTWDNLEMTLRAGDHPQVVISTTPRPIPILKNFVKESKESNSRIIVRTWSTYRNIANLAPTYINRMLSRYEGTRIGRQELHAEILEETEGALWKLKKIDELRTSIVPAFRMVAVGVDPPTSVGGECGIIVQGLFGDDIYTIDDMSMSGQPEDWGAQVVAAYNKCNADMVVPETNQGGDMVLSTIRAIDPSVPVDPVWASRGKRTRAEPIATYTEKGAMHHIGTFSALEDELTTWVPGNESPNRLDAYVHAATYLMNHTQYGAKRQKQARAF